MYCCEAGAWQLSEVQRLFVLPNEIPEETAVS